MNMFDLNPLYFLNPLHFTRHNRKVKECNLSKGEVVIIETLKAEAAMKVRQAELAREFPFKKRGFRKHVR